MALTSPSSGSPAASTDVSQFTDHLTGTGTEAWHLKAASGQNIKFTLPDAAGAQKFTIVDSADAEVFAVDSDGNLTVAGTNPTADLTGDDDDVTTYNTLLQSIDTRELEIATSSGRVSSVTSKDGATTVHTSTIAYNADGTIDTVTEVFGATTVTTTLAYSSGLPSGVTRVVS